MARKDDRRILKTRKQLRDSMMALILDKGYDDISIQDVTDKANLGRATFYLHYREKDELYEDLMRKLAEDFFASLPKRDPKQAKLLNIRNIKLLFEFVEDRYDFYRIIIMGRGAILSSVILTSIIKEYFRTQSEEHKVRFEELAGMPYEFLLDYNASALMSVIFWWLENEMPHTPEDMAKMVEKLSFFSNYQIVRAAKGDEENQELDALREGMDLGEDDKALPEVEPEPIAEIEITDEAVPSEAEIEANGKLSPDLD